MTRIRESDRDKKLLPPRVVAPMLGISKKTLWIWAKKGKIRPVKTPTGRFLYPETEVKRVLDMMYGYPLPSLRGMI